MWQSYHGYFWGMNWLWWILWFVLIFVLVFAFRSRPLSGSGIEKETPIDILKKRFSRGEISKEDYEERKKILERDA